VLGNGGDSLAVAADGPFEFPTWVASGSGYAVSVRTQPTSPRQNCTVGDGTGTVGGAAVISVRVNCGVGGLSLLAGQLGGPGNFDGTGSEARFLGIHGVAVDAGGSIYLADMPDQAIRKVSPAGLVTTVAGAAGAVGSADGAGAAARFAAPRGVALDAAGNLYIADSGNNTVRRMTPAGAVSTVAGDAGADPGAADGSGTLARFRDPEGVAVDAGGTVYVADTGNSTVRRLAPDGTVTTLAGSAASSGSQDGSGAAAGFANPGGIATDAAGTVFVADTANSTVRRLTPQGAVTTLAGVAGMPGRADGPGGAAQFHFPEGLAPDTSGNVYVADTANDTIRRIDPAGIVTTLAGSAPGSADGAGAAAGFTHPYGLTADRDGSLLVADTGNALLRRVTAAGLVTTLAGKAASPGSQDGSGAAAAFRHPLGIATDAAGSVYVADYGNHTIRRITPEGAVTTLAGSAGVAGDADGEGSAARLRYPTAVASGADGNLYVVDAGNYTVRRITPAGLVSTLAGSSGTPGYADGSGAAAQFYFDVNGWPSLVADAGGNLYVTDRSRIRRITPAGLVSTLAGNAGPPGSVDGVGAAARFSTLVSGIAIDAAGVLTVADTGNYTLRRVTSDGVVTTIAGTPGKQGTTDGSGAAARFNTPIGIAIDAGGTVYVADGDPGYGVNHVIRRVSSAGNVTTLVGTLASVGVRLGPLPASLNGPAGLALSPGALFISDAIENAVLRADLP
jgi:sugar lactone lactonase YvrE